MFRFGEGFNLRNSLVQIYDFSHFPLMCDRPAAAGMVVKANLHLSMISIGHEGRQQEPGGMGTLRKPSRTFPGSPRPGSSALNSSNPFGPGHDRAPKPSLPQRRFFSVLRPAPRRGGVRPRGGVAERERCVKGKTGGAPYGDPVSRRRTAPVPATHYCCRSTRSTQSLLLNQ